MEDDLSTNQARETTLRDVLVLLHNFAFNVFGVAGVSKAGWPELDDDAPIIPAYTQEFLNERLQAFTDSITASKVADHALLTDIMDVAVNEFNGLVELTGAGMSKWQLKKHEFGDLEG